MTVTIGPATIELIERRPEMISTMKLIEHHP
jgi:hypothetical protein